MAVGIGVEALAADQPRQQGRAGHGPHGQEKAEAENRQAKKFARDIEERLQHVIRVRE